MFPQITLYISSSLSPDLCGFRKGYNAQHAIFRLKNKLNKIQQMSFKDLLTVNMLDIDTETKQIHLFYVYISSFFILVDFQHLFMTFC